MGYLVPVDIDVQADAYPPAVADIAGDEETLWLAFDQVGLNTGGRRRPDGQPTVAVMVFPGGS